jgi:chromosome segregation ATPase
MASKDEFQDALKKKFGVNKNISQPLSKKECERLLALLYSEPSAAKLVESYADKNSSLGRNNANYARARNQTERKFEALQAEYFQLEKSIESIEEANTDLEKRKRLLEEEQRKLEAEVQSLSSKNQSLSSKLQILGTQNHELTVANTQLKKENKDLKNIVDQIRLRLARDTKALLQYEDSEIRKAVITLFKWTLG